MSNLELDIDWHEFFDRMSQLLTGCDHTLAASRWVLKDMGLGEAEVGRAIEKLKGHGGYCDCEVMMNAMVAILDN
jgi:hypothetical protein